MKNQINFKTYTMIAMLVVLFSFYGFAQDSKIPTLTKTFELNQPGTLNSKSSGGGIKVKTHDQSEVEVQAFIRKNGKILSPSDPSVADVLDSYELVIEKNGSVITATAERKKNYKRWNNMGISLTIIVPHEMSCNVSSSGGGLKISGVTGTHNFKSSGGSVILENTAGTTEAKSSGGKVQATKHKGDIHLSASGGGVTLDKAKGNVTAHSSGGSVKLNNIQGDVDAGSSGGGVSVSGECEYVKAKSSGGSVRVDISNLSKELYLQSSGGGVHADIARRDLESCAACHDTQGADPNCIMCHTDNDGIKGTNPKTHAIGFMNNEQGDWHGDFGAVCYNCHTDGGALSQTFGQGFCGYCHK